MPRSARLYVPSNCESPIAAQLEFVCDSGVEISVELDFLHTGTQTWTIDLETDLGPINLSAGGSLLTVGNERIEPAADVLASEYESIYRHFAGLIEGGRSEVDARPLQMVADVFLAAKHIAVEPFEDHVP